MTKIEKARTNMEDSEAQIGQLLHIAPEAQRHILFEAGIEWAETFCIADALWLTTQRDFWNWWRLRWADKTDLFLKVNRLKPNSWQMQRAETFANVTQAEAKEEYLDWMLNGAKQQLEVSFHHLHKKMKINNQVI